MKAIIVEDEKFAALRLESIIRQYDPEIVIAAKLESVKETVSWLRANPCPDLIFLDIQLEDGISFSIFEQITVDAPVIFTTAYDEYAIRAFKLKSIDYLLKPVSQEDLNAAMNKFKAWTGKDDQQQKLAELFHLILDKGRQYRDRFSVTVGEKLKTIEVGNISYFFSVSGISFVVMNDNRQYSLDLSLEKLAEELNPKDFFRVNRQYLLSHRALTNVFIYPKSRLKLELNPAAREDVFVSIDKVSEFKRWLDGRGHEGGIPS